jgi:hypothetical protein
VLSATERTVLYAALLLATVAAWSVTWMQSSDLPVWSPFLAQALCGGAWTTASVASSSLMWVSMMIAMMLPATTPVVDAYATIARRRRARREPYTPTLIFVGRVRSGLVMLERDGCDHTVAALSRRFPHADDAEYKPNTCWDRVVNGRLLSVHPGEGSMHARLP